MCTWSRVLASGGCEGRRGKREEKGAEREEEAVETEAERRTEKLKWARKEREGEKEKK